MAKEGSGRDDSARRWIVACIVGIHGISQQYTGGVALTSDWLNATHDGLIAADHRAIADGLNHSDLRVAFFGDLFRPSGGCNLV